MVDWERAYRFSARHLLHSEFVLPRLDEELSYGTITIDQFVESWFVEAALIEQLPQHATTHRTDSTLTLTEKKTGTEGPAGIGGHGGGGAILLADVFRGPGEDPLARPAGYVDGRRAVAVGIAGNRSMATKQAVEVAGLHLGIGL